jgi:nitronate monooxygenase
LNQRGEPIYGDRDVPDLAAFRKLGHPFWLGGSYGSPARVTEALESGAAGVQVGTPFAFCEESGLCPEIKRQALAMSRDHTTDVRSDPLASPTGFPFKVLSLPGSMSEETPYRDRQRVCDLGYLRHLYRKADGTIGMRCPAEQVDTYVAKGGDAGDTVGRKCVCNGLAVNVGIGQVRARGGAELPLVTCGDDVRNIADFLPTPDAESYTARDVIGKLLAGVEARAALTAASQDA